MFLQVSDKWLSVPKADLGLESHHLSGLWKLGVFQVGSSLCLFINLSIENIVEKIPWWYVLPDGAFPTLF